MKLTCLFYLFLLIGGLAACADDELAQPKAAAPDKPVKEEKIVTDHLICPQVAILAEAQRIKDYGGEKTDPVNLAVTAEMRHVDGKCAYHNDKEKPGIDINFTLTIKAQRGPHLGLHAGLPYFIAIVDPSEKILSRQMRAASFTFDEGANFTDDDEDLHVFIPLARKDLLAGPDYRVLVGFQQKQGLTLR